MSKILDNECCNTHQITSDFYDRILGYIITKVHDKEDAKDITQEVMGRLIDAYNKNISISNIKAWLFQVARNAISDHYRRKNILDFEELNLKPAEDNEGFNIMAEDYIIPMINLLPEDIRTPLYMSDIENIKQADIAKKLNISLSATKMRCLRARKKLHELFLECCDIQYTENGNFASCTIKTSCSPLIEESKKIKNK